MADVTESNDAAAKANESGERQQAYHRAAEMRRVIETRRETDEPARTESDRAGEARAHRLTSRADRAAEARRLDADVDETDHAAREAPLHTLTAPADRVAEVRASSPEVFDRFEKKTDAERMRIAVQEIGNIKELRPEVWERSDVGVRRAVLDNVGDAYLRAYGTPAPMMLDKEFPEYKNGILKGFYSDRDFELQINEYLMKEHDPKAALETYSHEYRHAYQHDQAATSEKPQFANSVHDRQAARAWKENLDHYQDPGDPKVDYDTYYNQPVERDARDFAQRILLELYGEAHR